ncbi:hypothetical protein [Caulobacter rhizosphaerae]|uniref:hypothetical protein n=1 Tax=Caulobacter rhizosphaerae TaxID=2010972 RepID=UPI0013D0F0E1|nr:hypothetical protein [Caulobacter rhizosphaerae]GGL35574.1 hypothetical protein GCM10010983_35710 [Caulobacter rhizosphaerae]
MSVFRVLGEEVVTKSEYLESRSADPDRPSPLEAALGGAKGLESDLTGATQFVPIGSGQPLTVLIREVYTGKHPKKTILGGGDKSMLVTTALKGYATYAPASRAVNFAEPGIGSRRQLVAPSAVNAGTNVVAYSPAVLTDQLIFTVEMAFDRFPEGLLNTIASSFTKAAAVPLLLPAREYLLAAGGLLKIATDWADALVDGEPAFSSTDTIDFDIPGVVPAKADFRVMGSEDHRGLTYKPGLGLVSATGTRYDGDSPYVVVSLDGAERKSLESFAPTLATAEQLKKFLNAKTGAEASIDALMQGIQLANDIAYREQALKLQAEISAETDAKQKEAKTKRLEAIKKNILTAELKPG